VSAASDLLSNYQHVIDELIIVTGGAGVFDVVVNDDVIYSKAQTGRHAEPGEILALFTDLVGPGTARYGT